MYTLFTAHPRKVNETYVEHFFIAARIGLQMVGAGLACLIHAVFPFWFERTASETIFKLVAMFAARRDKAAAKQGDI